MINGATDTGHFTGNRRWGDVQLMYAIKKASSWDVLGGRVGIYLRTYERYLVGDATSLLGGGPN